MNKYEKYSGMTSDDLTDTCIKLEKERGDWKEQFYELQGVNLKHYQDLNTLKDAVKEYRRIRNNVDKTTHASYLQLKNLKKAEDKLKQLISKP